MNDRQLTPSTRAFLDRLAQANRDVERFLESGDPEDLFGPLPKEPSGVFKGTKAQLRMMVESIPCDDDDEVEVFTSAAQYSVVDNTAIRLSVWGGVLGGSVNARPKPSYANTETPMAVTKNV